MSSLDKAHRPSISNAIWICPLILGRVRQPLWGQVQEKFGQIRSLLGLNLAGKGNLPSLIQKYCCTATFFHSSVQQLPKKGLESRKALKKSLTGLTQIWPNNSDWYVTITQIWAKQSLVDYSVLQIWAFLTGQ